jgi:mono/diheme cytochrome c family protein
MVLLCGMLTVWAVAAFAAQRGPVAGGAPVSTPPSRSLAAPSSSLAAAQDVVAKTCVGCHNDRARAGNLSLQSFDLNAAAEHADVTEKMIRKLRAGMMPPAGARRPARWAWTSRPSPSRLNRRS